MKTLSTDFKIALGGVLHDLRVEKGLTLREVANRSNVALGYISEIEHGKKEASSSVMECLANAIEVPLHQIVIETGYVMAGWDFTELEREELALELEGVVL